MAYLDLKEGMNEDDDGNRSLSIANYDAELDEDITASARISRMTRKLCHRNNQPCLFL